MQGKKLVVIGYYGDNIGDILMLFNLIDYLKARYYQIDVITYCEIKDQNILDTLKSSVNIHYIRVGQFIKGISVLFKALKNSSAIIWGGGTCFHDQGGEGAFKYMLISGLLGKKVYYVGIGIDNVNKKSLKFKIWMAAWLSEAIVLRDPDSVERIKKITGRRFNKKIYLAYDLIYLSDINYRFIEIKENNLPFKSDLVIAYRNVDQYFNNSKQLLSEFIEHVKSFIVNNRTENIYVISTDNEIDESDSEIITKSLIDSFPGIKVIHKDFTISQKFSIIKDTGFVITGRLHVGIISYLCNIDFVLLNYSAKNASFIREINKEINLIEFNNLKEIAQHIPSKMTGNNTDEVLFKRSKIKQVLAEIDL